MNLKQRREWIGTFADIALQIGGAQDRPYYEAIAKLRNHEMWPLEECYAVPGEKHIIDNIDPTTDLTLCCGETAEQVRLRHPSAVRLTFYDWSKEQAKLQDTPVTWLEVTEAKHNYALEVLPPIDWHVGNGFLVGEAVDHHMVNGRARYDGYVSRCGKFYQTSRPVTRAEFRNLKASLNRV